MMGGVPAAEAVIVHPKIIQRTTTIATNLLSFISLPPKILIEDRVNSTYKQPTDVLQVPKQVLPFYSLIAAATPASVLTLGIGPRQAFDRSSRRMPCILFPHLFCSVDIPDS